LRSYNLTINLFSRLFPTNLKNGDFFQWRIDFDANHDDLHINVQVGDQPYDLRINGFKLCLGMGASEDIGFDSIIENLTGQDFTNGSDQRYYSISEFMSAKAFVDYIFEMSWLRNVS